MSLSTGGVLKINFLSGSTNRLLQINPAGEIIPFNMGNPSQVLYGDGSWADLPSGSNAWSIIGNHISNTNSGNVGNGQVWVGKKRQASGPHTDFDFAVDGKIVAKSCYIRVTDWADNVFEKDYMVPHPYDIENYYLTNKHLEGIPSEKEVLEKGVEVGEMNRLLLKKIEEMTILLVKQQREIDSIKTTLKSKSN